MAFNTSGASGIPLSVHGVIYLITHIDSGRTYIGQTTQPNPIQRWHVHVFTAGKRCTWALGNAIAKYGKRHFTFEILQVANSQEELDNLECLWIIATGSLKGVNGFNIRGGGSRGKHSEETKAKLSIIAKARHAANPDVLIERNRRLGQANRGKLGWKPNAERRVAIAKEMKARYESNPGWFAEQGKKNSVHVRNNWASLSVEERQKRLAPMKAARWRRDGI